MFDHHDLEKIEFIRSSAVMQLTSRWFNSLEVKKRQKSVTDYKFMPDKRAA